MRLRSSLHSTSPHHQGAASNLGITYIHNSVHLKKPLSHFQ